jgi:hypothetical protein
VCVRARAIAGAVERGAHLSARRMGMCVPVNRLFHDFNCETLEFTTLIVRL